MQRDGFNAPYNTKFQAYETREKVGQVDLNNKCSGAKKGQ